MKDLSDRLLAEGGIEGCANGAFVVTGPLMACDAADAYNLERIGQDRYRLSLAVPGFDEAEIDVSAYGGSCGSRAVPGLPRRKATCSIAGSTPRWTARS